MNTDMTMVDVLKYAIKLEHESRSFYDAAARQFEEGEVRELVETLRDEEIKHENRLTGILSDNDKDAQVVLEESMVKRLIHNQEIELGSSMKEVLGVALEREKLTRDFYRQISTMSHISADVISAFDMLFEQESGHVTKISHMLDRM